MSKIIEYRRLLGVDKMAELKELKTVYRNFMKECHPDKFQNDAEGLAAAEQKSKKIIEAYHFLVSIAPETQAQHFEAYTATITTATIVDFQYKGQTLRIDFSDGSSYEYYDVPKATYTKLVNADTQGRFARRHICTSFVYRNISNMNNSEAE